MMLLIPLMTLVSTLTTQAQAQTNCDDPRSYLVFSNGTINGSAGDTQGLTGATGAVNLGAVNGAGTELLQNAVDRGYATKADVKDIGTGFSVNNNDNACPPLVAGGVATLDSGSALNAPQAGQMLVAAAERDNASPSENPGPVQNGPLHIAANYYYTHSVQLSRVPGQTVNPGVIDKAAGLSLTPTADQTSKHIQVYKVSSLNGITNISLSGGPDDVVVINVTDSIVNLKDFKLSLGGLQRSHVIFNFPNATELYINHTNLAASILAPNAKTALIQSGINGGLYVGDLTGVHGQVNDNPPDWNLIQGVINFSPNTGSCDSTVTDAPPSSGNGTLSALQHWIQSKINSSSN